MGAKAALEVVLPVALVLLVAGEPEHGPLPVPLVVGPVAVVVVSAGVGHLTLAPLHASLPLALVDRAILVGQGAGSVPHAVEPRPLVLDTLLGVDVLACPVSEAVLDTALESRAVWPRVTADTGDLVLAELSLVDGPICPAERSLSVEEPVLELALVGVPVPELASSLPVKDLTNLKEYENLNISCILHNYLPQVRKCSISWGGFLATQTRVWL